MKGIKVWESNGARWLSIDTARSRTTNPPFIDPKAIQFVSRPKVSINMKSLAIAAALLSAVTATPVAEPSIAGIEHLTSLSHDDHVLKRYTSGTSADDLAGPCRAVTVIFARGTTEPGNVGSLAGPPFFTALNAVLGASNVAVQGVAYPADIPGYLAGGSAAGASTLASLTNQAASKCPNTKIVLSGYR